MTFLTNPIVVVVLVAGILAGGVFVVSRWGKLGSGTGGVTGAPKTPQNPLGTMKPTGTGSGTVTKPPGEQL